MIYCFDCIFTDDLAVPAPGQEDRFTPPRPGGGNPDRIAHRAVTIVDGKAKCIGHFSRDHREPMRVLDAR